MAQSRQATALGVDLSRREFMARVAAMGLSVTAFAAFARAFRQAKAAPVLAAPPPAPALGPPSAPESTGPVVEPTPFPQTPLARIAHLLRRAGFGASPAELERFIRMGADATVDYLLEYERVDDSALEERLASLTFDFSRPNDLMRWWLIRMVYTQRPLQEKMVLFWHGILTSGLSKVGRGPLMLAQNELFRRHALGTYDTLLKAVSKDPAMLIWLDGRTNRRSAPNENYSRELMELFTMGVGNYTEEDVRESARAFSGWSIDREGRAAFNPRQHDDGVKTFLGRRGNFNGDDIVDIILEQPASHRYITRRLFEFFVYDEPSDQTVERLAATFRDSRYSIKAVMRDILTSREFYSDRAYRAQAKSPAELVAGTFRTLGVDVQRLPIEALTVQMGQRLFDPPDVSGWPGGAAWFNSTTLLHRINFAHRIARAYRDQLLRDPATAQLSGSAIGSRVRALMAMLVDGNVTTGEETVLKAFVDELSRSPSVDRRRLGAEVLSAVTYLLMASPGYQVA